MTADPQYGLGGLGIKGMGLRPVVSTAQGERRWRGRDIREREDLFPQVVDANTKWACQRKLWRGGAAVWHTGEN